VTVIESKTGVKKPKIKNEGNHTTANTIGAKREEIQVQRRRQKSVNKGMDVLQSLISYHHGVY